MRLPDDLDISTISSTIWEVAQAQSGRMFKSEVNTEARSAMVFLAIRAEIALALFDLGVLLDQVLTGIDPTDAILSQMLQTGYKFSVDQLLRGVVSNV